ncbi:phage head closure protein [Paraburkholderia caribensis]|uniref:phage head closure protein n=1 Tax=Paraburkholderia caribensis TaxID=75105 RepID=UPI003F570A81
MRAGAMNRRVRIERHDPACANGDSVRWLPVVTVWADVRMLSGRESIASDALISRLKASVRIRYRTDVKPGMRALVDDLIFRIEAVLPDVSRREFADLVCVSDEG